MNCVQDSNYASYGVVKRKRLWDRWIREKRVIDMKIKFLGHLLMDCCESITTERDDDERHNLRVMISQIISKLDELHKL